MIHPEKCVSTLIASGAIPDDSEIVSTNNKVVTISKRQRLVARISEITSVRVRDDPHDLTYSHNLAFILRQTAPVGAPIEQYPIQSDGYLLSRYPLLQSSVSITPEDAQEVYECLDTFAVSIHSVETGDQPLRQLYVPGYVQERLEHMHDRAAYDQTAVEYVSTETARLNQEYPFAELTTAQRSLVHGDVKVDNFVRDDINRINLIDLDATAIGPKTYDLASWRLRAELGDTAPVESIVEAARSNNTWSEEAYRALIGWKAVSSMSFSLRYEGEKAAGKITDIAHAAFTLGGIKTPQTNKTGYTI